MVPEDPTGATRARSVQRAELFTKIKEIRLDSCAKTKCHRFTEGPMTYQDDFVCQVNGAKVLEGQVN